MASTTKRRAPKRATRAVVSTAIQTKPGGPFVGNVMPTAGYGNRRRVVDRAIDADLTRLNGVFDRAAMGQTRELIDTYKSTYIRDSRLYAVVRTRVHAISARPWIVKPPPGMESDAEAKDIAERVTAIFNETQGLAKLLATLGYGAVEGFAVAQHQWRTNTRGEWVSQPEWVHSNRFAWDMTSLELCKCEPNQDSPPGKPLSTWPGKFVVHSPAAGAADYPWYRGAIRSRIIPSVTKRFGLKWWLKALERWGQPQVYATIDPELREGVGEEVDTALRAMGSAWFARFPQGTEVKGIPVALDASLHSTWIDWHNTEDAIALLGQNLTTEVTSGSYAAAATHQKVRLDILAADLNELAETITDQWIRWIVYYNWPGAPVPHIDFVLAPQSEITVQHYQAGLFTRDQVAESMGFDAEPDGKGSRYSEAAAVPAGATTVMPSATPDAAAASVADTALNGAQVTSLQGLLASIKDGTLAAGAAKIMIAGSFPTFTSEQVEAMVNAQSATATPAAGAPTPAPALASATPPSELLITPGDIWIDTTDQHQIQVVRQVGTTVYLVDLDAENPAKQFAWQVSHFLEICSPPDSAIPSAPGGAPADAPLASTKPSAMPTSSRSKAHPFATTLSRR